MYNRTVKEVISELETDKEKGVSSEDAKIRLEKGGLNKMPDEQLTPFWKIFIKQFFDFLILILLVAVVMAIALNEIIEGCVILFVVILNALIGAIQEGQAQSALASLKDLTTDKATVIRDGKKIEINTEEIVVGDVVVLEAGMVVPADIRLFETSSLQIDESILTGESVPVSKDANTIFQDDTFVGDRTNSCFYSTAVTFGRGIGVVTKTGSDTEVGKIADMLQTKEVKTTPLERKINRIGKVIGIIAILLVPIIVITEVIEGRPFVDMLLVAVALAVGVVPEALPSIISIVLAIGVKKMANKNAIVKKLPTVETLGSVNVICTDKTGTLTENKMTVESVYMSENNETMSADEIIQHKNSYFIKGFTLCENAKITAEQRIGDPTELAFIDLAHKAGVDIEKLESKYFRINENPFGSDRKMMSTLHQEPEGGKTQFTKGGLDIIITKCNRIFDGTEIREFTSDDFEKLALIATGMSEKALRVLALAMRTSADAIEEKGMIFVGLAGLKDPPRKGVDEAIAEFKRAGIKTVMITGDYKHTAFAIAKDIGIAESEDEVMSGNEIDILTDEEFEKKVNDIAVFARVTPEHKVRIVKAIKANGNITAMTGDGVNDAPSLKKADIGVAMGNTGSDVAKSASNMVLTDDNFITIRTAVEEGRKIFANIKKTVSFLMITIYAEVLLVFATLLFNLPVPLTAIQILFLNLVTDSIPALALGIGKTTEDVMRLPPNKNVVSFFDMRSVVMTGLFGFASCVLSFLAFLYPAFVNGFGFYFGDAAEKGGIILDTGMTYAFIVMCTSQLFIALMIRDRSKSIFKINHLTNPLLLLSIFLGILLQIIICSVPVLNTILHTAQIGFIEWVVLILIAFVPVLLHEIYLITKKLFRG